jgi:CheY-like chemotaxis protein
MTNAAEATGDPAKAVVLRTGMCAPARTAARPDHPTTDGVWVFLEVEDHGCGMSEDVRAKMFEPFFSTKRAGRGLGLSTAMGTVKSHGGTVEVETAPGAGTRVRVSFPALAGARSPDVIREPKPAASGTREAARVLVVDDESLVLNVTRELLARTGHTVSTASSGEAALAILETSPSAFDVALIDLRMPGIGGLETMRRARRINPGLPVVIVSGNVFDAPSEATLPDGVVLLPKPFTVQQLTGAIGHALGGRTTITS